MVEKSDKDMADSEISTGPAGIATRAGSARPWVSRGLGSLLTAVLFLALAFAVLRLLWVWSWAIAFPYDIDYGEGPLLNSARLLANGGGLYPNRFDDYPYIVTEHPPVVVALLAAGIRAFGVGYAPGRVLGLISTFGAAVAIYLILLTLGTRRKAAWVGAGLFLAMPFLPYWAGLSRVDLPALAFTLFGLLAVLRWPDRTRGLVCAALLFTLAAYSRQTYLLAGPLAASGWLFLTDRRRTLPFIGLLGGMGGVPFVVLNVATDGGFYLNTVASNLQDFSFAQLWRFSSTVAVWLPLLLLLGLLEMILAVRTRRPAALVLVLYLLGSLASVISSGKIGASINYFLEFMVGLSALSGLALDRWIGKGSRQSGLLLLTMAAQVLLMVDVGFLYQDHVLSRIALLQELSHLETLVQQEDSGILADEFLGLLVLNDKPVLLRPFHFSQMAAAGQWDQTRVLADIQGQRFALILITDQPPLASQALAQDRWTPEMWTAIHEYYHTVEITACTSVLRPAPRP